MIKVNTNYSFIKFFLLFFFLEGLFSSCASSHASNFSNWVKLSAPNSISPNTVGIASFRRGRFGVVVFSSHFNVRLNKIKSRPGFHEARVISLPNATVILNPIDSDQVLKVKTNTSSWSLGVEKRNKSFPLKMSLIKFPEASIVSHSANSTVVVLDPVTGDPILVGTVTKATAVRDTFHDVAYTIWPTWQGIAVHVLSDEDRLLIGNRKIHLAEVYSKIKNPTNKLSTLRPTFTFHHFKLFFNFPKTSVKDLRLHLLRAQTSIAAKPPLDRLRASLRLAQVLLGLGLGPEARAVLESAFYDDPASVENVRWKTLLAVADLLNDRPNEFAKLVQNEGGKSPEMRLWRGIALAEQGNNNAAEKLLVHGLSIFLGYPEPLKSYFSPIIAEAFISSGHFFAAKSFLGALPSQLALGLARAQLFEALHHDVKALTAYKKLRQSRDVRVAGIATGKVVMLRYLLHHISAKKAAADLSRDLYSWRGSSNELSIRLSLASLRAKAGKLAQALHGLRRSEKLFPSDLKQLEHERQELFNNMLASGELKNLKPLKVVTILEENEDLVPAGAKGAVILKI